MFRKAVFTTLTAMASIKGHTEMDIPSLLQEFIEDNNGVGASVGLIDNGEIRYFSYGKKSIDGEEPITEHSVFEIGSITKVFTTLALMDLVERGVVQLDDPIERYLPGVRIPEKDGVKITLRHLATHTSGLYSVPPDFAPKDPSNPYQDFTVEVLYDALNRTELTRAPGEGFEYSNVGMGLLGHILTLQTEKSYGELIQDLISEELEMKHTAIALTPNMIRQAVDGHHLRKKTPYWDIPALPGAGALRSNVVDMTHFLAASMGQSSLAPLFQKCQEKQVDAAPDVSFGFGWVRSISSTAELIWHNGGTGGFRCYLGFNPATKKGVVVLSNTTVDWPDEFGAALLDPGYQRPPVDKNLAGDPAYLKQFAGSYEATLLHDQSKLDVVLDVSGKQLIGVFSGKDHGTIYPTLYPKERDVFGIKASPNVSIRFLFDEKRAVSKIEGFFDGEKVWEAVPKKS